MNNRSIGRASLVLILVLVAGGRSSAGPGFPFFLDGFENPEPVFHDFPSPTSDAQEPVIDDMDADAAAVYPPGGSVVVSSGEKRLDRVDLAVPGRGQIHFTMHRRYRSRLDYDGPLGFGWDFTYNERLSIQPNGDVVRANGMGHVDTWISVGGGDFTPPLGFFGTLTQKEDDSYILRETDGFKRFYSPGGLLQMYRDRFGNEMGFSYDAGENLVLVTDVFGRDYEFEYLMVAGTPRISLLRDFAGREVVYSYDGAGDLESVRSPVVVGTSIGNDFPAGRTEAYSYSSGHGNADLNHNLLTVTYPVEVAAAGPPAIICVYGDSGIDVDRVTSMALGGTNGSGVPAGGSITFDYLELNMGMPSDPALPRLQVSVTERNGNQREYFINELEHLIELHELTQGLRPGHEPPDHWLTAFEYDADGQLTRLGLHEGNHIEFTYETAPRAARKNLLEMRRVADLDRGGGEDLVTTYSYEPLYNQVRTITDPRGNAGGFVPPIGSASAERYTVQNFFDYQEHNDPVPEATEYGIDLSVMSRGLGDLNSDGVTNQSDGNPVRIEAPVVNLRPGSNQAIQIGSTVQEIITELQWNDRGQINASIDQEGNLATWARYPENDPDGDGNPVPGQVSTTPRGYVEFFVDDNSPPPPRRTTSAPPAELETLFGYDEVGNVISRRNPRGVVDTYEITALNELVVATFGADVSQAVTIGELLTGEAALGYQRRFHFDANGRVVLAETENRADVSTTDGVGDWVERTFVYDILDNLVEVNQEVDMVTTTTTQLRYDENESPNLLIKPEGNQYARDYDERQLLFRTHEGFGSADVAVRQVDYDGNANVVRLIDAEDNDAVPGPEETTLTYDGFDRRIVRTDPLGDEVVWTFDVASNITRLQRFGHEPDDPLSGNVLLTDVSFSHDELNRAYQTDRELFLATGFSPINPVDLRDFDDDGKVTDYNEYDALSRSTFTVEDDGDIFAVEYDGVDRAILTRDALDNTQSFEYDRGHNLVFTLSHEVSPEGLVPAEDFRRWMVYDQYDRLVRDTMEDGRTSRYGYDSRDNLTTTSDGNGPLLMSDPWGVYTGSGQINDDGNTVTYFYDGRDLMIREVADLRVDGQGGNPLDLSNPFNPDGQVITEYGYDLNARFSALTDDNGHTTSYAYDDLDRMVSQTNADLASDLNEFDRDNNLVTRTDFNGSVITNTYDALNRLRQRDIVRAAGVVGTTQELYGYDGISRLTFGSDDNGSAMTVHTVSLIYDSLGRIIEKQQDTNTISSVFSGDGNLEVLTYPSGRVVERSYDELNRLKNVDETMPSPANIAEYFWIGPCIGPGCTSRFLELHYGNGVEISFLNNAGDTDIGWSDVREIAEMNYRVGGLDHLRRTYEHDRTLDNRTSQVRHEVAGEPEDISEHNSVYWLTRWIIGGPDDPGSWDLEGEHEYDGVGNLHHTTLTQHFHAGGTSEFNMDYSVNEVNEYVVADGVPYTYDDNGNLVNSHGFHQRHNYRNQLVLVERESDLAPFTRYYYNTLGERVVTEIYPLAARSGESPHEGPTTPDETQEHIYLTSSEFNNKELARSPVAAGRTTYPDIDRMIDDPGVFGPTSDISYDTAGRPAEMQVGGVVMFATGGGQWVSKYLPIMESQGLPKPDGGISGTHSGNVVTGFSPVRRNRQFSFLDYSGSPLQQTPERPELFEIQWTPWNDAPKGHPTLIEQTSDVESDMTFTTGAAPNSAPFHFSSLAGHLYLVFDDLGSNFGGYDAIGSLTSYSILEFWGLCTGDCTPPFEFQGQLNFEKERTGHHWMNWQARYDALNQRLNERTPGDIVANQYDIWNNNPTGFNFVRPSPRQISAATDVQWLPAGSGRRTSSYLDMMVMAAREESNRHIYLHLRALYDPLNPPEYPSTYNPNWILFDWRGSTGADVPESPSTIPTFKEGGVNPGTDPTTYRLFGRGYYMNASYRY